MVKPNIVTTSSNLDQRRVNGNYEMAMRTFKRKVQKEGILALERARQRYIKPAVKRKEDKLNSKKKRRNSYRGSDSYYNSPSYSKAIANRNRGNRNGQGQRKPFSTNVGHYYMDFGMNSRSNITTPAAKTE